MSTASPGRSSIRARSVELFPDVPEKEWPFRQRVDREAVYLLTEGGSVKIPTPPTMKNHGNYAASLSEVVRWMGERAEALGVNVFPGFPADALLVEGSTVRGVRTTPTGLNREREPGDGYMDPADLTAKVTVLTEGTRGTLGQAWRAWQKVYVTQSPDLRPRREGSLAGQATARSHHPHAGMAAPPRRVRRIVHVPDGAVPGRDRTGRGPRLRQRPPRRARAAAADEAASAVPSGARRAAICSNGAPRRFPRAASTRCRTGSRATGSSWPATPPASWTCRRSRGSTTPCRPACSRRARRSRRSRAATTRRTSCRSTTRPRARATWPRTCAAPATCGSRSRMASTWADSRPA